MSVRLSDSGEDEFGEYVELDASEITALGVVQPTEKEGWMHKRGGKNTAYKKRYFVLRNKVLKYYKNQKDMKPKGKVMLQGCEVHALPHNVGKNADIWEFNIKSNIFSRVYTFSCTTDSLRGSWIAALESHIRWDEDRAEATLKAAREAKEAEEERKGGQDQVSDLLSESLKERDRDKFLTTADRHRIGSQMPSPFGSQKKDPRSAFATPKAKLKTGLHLDISDEFLGIAASASASTLDMDGWRRDLSRRGIDDSFANAKEHIRTCRRAPSAGFSNATALSTHNKRNWLAVTGNDAMKTPLSTNSKVRLMTAVESKYDPRQRSYSLLSLEEMYSFDIDSKIVADVSWCDDNVLVGADQGRVLLFDYPWKPEEEEEEVEEEPVATFVHCNPNNKTEIVGSDGNGSFSAPCPGKPIDSTVVRKVAACPSPGSNYFLSLINNHMFVWDFEREDKPIFCDGTSFRALRACSWNPHSHSGQFVVGDDGRTLRVMDLRVDAKSSSASTGTVWQVQDAHHDYIRDVSWSPLARPWIASASEDGSVKVWDIRYVKNAQPVSQMVDVVARNTTNVANRVLAAHASAVNCVNWSNAHVHHLVSGSVDGTLKLWDMRASPHFVGFSHNDGTSCVVGCSFSSTHPFQYFSCRTDGSIEGCELGQPFLAHAVLDTEYASLSSSTLAGCTQSTEQGAARMHKPATPQATPARSSRGSRWSSIKRNIDENAQNRKQGSSSSRDVRTSRAVSSSAPNAMMRLKGRQKAAEVDRFLYLRDYQLAFKAIIDLCNMFLLHDLHSDAALLFNLIDEHKFERALEATDAEEEVFSFTKLLLTLSSSFTKQGLSLSLPAPADVDRLGVLRLRMRLNELMIAEDSEALFGLENEILERIAQDAFGTPEDSNALVSVTETLLRADHMRALHFGRKLGKLLHDKGNFQFFFPVARLLFSPTIFTKDAVRTQRKSSVVQSPLAKFLKKNTDVRRVDDKGTSPLAAFMQQNVSRVSMAVAAKSEQRQLLPQAKEVLLDELRRPHTMFKQLQLLEDVLLELAPSSVVDASLNAWNPYKGCAFGESKDAMERVLHVPMCPSAVAKRIIRVVEDAAPSPEDLFKVFPACVHRLYLMALFARSNLTRLFVVATNVSSQLQAQSQLGHQIKSMLSDAAVPKFERVLHYACDMDNGEDVWVVDDACTALVNVAKMLQSCAYLPAELTAGMPAHLDAVGKRIKLGLTSMYTDESYAVSGDQSGEGGAVDARDRARELLQELHAVEESGRKHQRCITEFNEEFESVSKILQHFA